MLSHDSIIWRLERSHKSKAHSLLPSPALLPLNPEKQAPASHFAYDSSCAISETTGDLSEEKIALIEATQSNRSRQHRCKRGRHFFFSCLFFLKLQLVLLEKFVKLHQWRSETLVWKGAAGERTPPGFQIPWNQWSEWHWCFYSR